MYYVQLHVAANLSVATDTLYKSVKHESGVMEQFPFGFKKWKEIITKTEAISGTPFAYTECSPYITTKICPELYF